jgi:hypothetical protein
MEHDATACRIDRAAVGALGDERTGWQHKAVPPALWGSTVAEVRERRPRLSELPTPLLTLSRGALDHNVRVMADWCAARGLSLAPHGKTTMAPALWADQVAAGAWAITVANHSQLAVARAFGVTRVMVANSLISPLALRALADDLAAHPDVRVLVWADDAATVRLMHEALDAHAVDGARRPVDVLVERGGAGGRTGARSLAAALRAAEAVVASPHLRLAGVAAETGVVMLLYLDHAWEDITRGGRRPTTADLVRAIEYGAVNRLRPKLMTVAAIMLGYFGGQEFGTAIADVVFGAAEPGGRLTTTWPAALADVPVLDVTPNDGALPYDEGVHIGYRAWLRKGAEPAYPFGFGLGYTTWRFDSATVSGDLSGELNRDDAVLQVRVTNTGDRAGKHVVQVYAERTSTDIDRPARWLVGFAPVRAESGRTTEVTIPLRARAFAHWDAGWQYEPGEFRLRIGSSVVDLPLDAAVKLNGTPLPDA